MLDESSENVVFNGDKETYSTRSHSSKTHPGTQAALSGDRTRRVPTVAKSVRMFPRQGHASERELK